MPRSSSACDCFRRARRCAGEISENHISIIETVVRRPAAVKCVRAGRSRVSDHVCVNSTKWEKTVTSLNLDLLFIFRVFRRVCSYFR